MVPPIWTTSSAVTSGRWRQTGRDLGFAHAERGIPSICYGLRGLVYCQIDLRGTKTDLHSGSFGGAVANPALCLRRSSPR